MKSQDRGRVSALALRLAGVSAVAAWFACLAVCVVGSFFRDASWVYVSTYVVGGASVLLFAVVGIGVILSGSPGRRPSVEGRKWRDNDNNWRVDVENPNNGIGQMHLQSNQSGAKSYHDFSGEPGDNNWYTEAGEQLSAKDYRNLSKMGGFGRAAQKGWDMSGGEGPIRSIAGAPFQSSEEGPLDELNVGAP